MPVDRHGLQVAEELVDFVENEVLPGLELAPARFWQGLAEIYTRFTPVNRRLLVQRDELQSTIDAWHIARRGQDIDTPEYRRFLEEIGYLVPGPAPFTVETTDVDPEIATLAGPQLVVPALNTRFALNAANARWGSLYDALYGTDVLDAPPAQGGGYDAARGAAVVAYARHWLDQVVPLDGKSWRGLQSLDAIPAIAWRGSREEPAALLLRNNGLHIELRIDRTHPVGEGDPLGIADIILEAALSTIIDLEDSVAAVDAADKLAGYRTWLGLMRGDLTATFDKNGHSQTRALEPDREWVGPDGPFTLPGRSVLFVRNVGHLMTTPAIRMPDGSEGYEGILDAVMTATIGVYDLRQQGRVRNSRAGSVYIVKPKMHGPEEARLTNELFDAVEDLLDLPRHTLKVGVMDEERRTSANLAACIAAVKGRIAFINTGFLDRTGDEIHTSMQAGAMVRKAAMKDARWIKAYEARNVATGLACGLSGRAQIGKGMWAAPDRMRDMVEQKIAHPKTGANTAWVPSPTAATLHAMHYHAVDVFAVQQTLPPAPPLDELLAIPPALGQNWSAKDIARELDNNAQGILGYVVRWIDQGVGCSKVPDIDDIGLMEDRATLRISSQHMANWLLHGICDEEQVRSAFTRMADKVNAQNARDPLYRPLTPDSLAYRAALDLVFKGTRQPNGYTEPLLHDYRRRAKRELSG